MSLHSKVYAKIIPRIISSDINHEPVISKTYTHSALRGGGKRAKVKLFIRKITNPNGQADQNHIL